MATLHHETVLPRPGDSAEWCPATSFESCLAVGTYKLNESDRSRSGGFELYELVKASGNPGASSSASSAAATNVTDQEQGPSDARQKDHRLVLRNSLLLPAVLDLKWRDGNGGTPGLGSEVCGTRRTRRLSDGISQRSAPKRALLGAALADGSLQVWEILQEVRGAAASAAAACPQRAQCIPRSSAGCRLRLSCGICEWGHVCTKHPVVACWSRVFQHAVIILAHPDRSLVEEPVPGQ